MKVNGTLIAIGTLALLAACGSDSKKNAACPEGTKAGAELPCDCGKLGKVGKQTCQMDMTLTDCACPDGSSTDGGTGSGGSGSMSSGSGGKGSTGGMNSGTGGKTSGGGTGGSSAGGGEEDGGMTSTPTDGGTGGTVTPLPMDGNQLASCATGVDCNKGLDCYNPAGPAQGFCTKAGCMSDDDCKGLTGGTYTCAMSGLCELSCMGTDDKSCPDQMACVQTGTTGGGGPGGPGGGGGTPVYHCTYPEGAGVVKQPVWGKCTSFTSADCETDLVCSGMGFTMTGTTPGYCAETCMKANDCTKPKTGAIDPTCVASGFGGGGPMGGGMQMMHCTLDCAMNADGCPDGMKCIMNPGFMGMGASSRCGYE